MAMDVQIIDLAREMILTVMMLAGPVLAIGLMVGLAVSLLQALTSVQEQTMSLVPKMFAVFGVTLMLMAPGLSILREYTLAVLGRLAEFGAA